MSDICVVCSDPIPTEDGFTHCSINKCKLHFECASVSENTWINMGASRQKTWKCKICRGKTITPDSISKMHEELLQKMQDSIKEQFSVLSAKFDEKINELTKSVEFVCGKIDDYEGKMTSFENKIKQLEQTNETLTSKHQKLQTDYSNSQEQFNSLEQYNRNRNLQIDGVPQDENENVESVLSKLSNIVGEPLDCEKDIQAAHRVPTKSNSGIKPIIVQFSNRKKRDSFLQKSKKVTVYSTHFMSTVSKTNVYVNEHLTMHNKELLFKAKQLKEKGFKFVWPKEGKIFAKQSESPNHKTIPIKSQSDLEKILKSLSG